MAADEAASLAAAVAVAADAAASEAATDASEADELACDAATDAAAASLAGAAACSLLDLLHAARARTVSSEATRRDFFMITSFYG